MQGKRKVHPYRLPFITLDVEDKESMSPWKQKECLVFQRRALQDHGIGAGGGNEELVCGALRGSIGLCWISWAGDSATRGSRQPGLI